MNKFNLNVILSVTMIMTMDRPIYRNTKRTTEVILLIYLSKMMYKRKTKEKYLAKNATIKGQPFIYDDILRPINKNINKIT